MAASKSKKKSMISEMAGVIASELSDLNNTQIDAIQNVPGDTKAQKLKFLSRKSWEIITTDTGWNDVPVALHPLVNSMIVKKTANHRLLINTLTSNDEMVVKRALLVDNFFIDEKSPLLNFEFFYEKILADVCLLSRGKIIRKLASCLTLQKPCVSKEFYTGIFKIYGIQTAIPLLYACDQEFILQQIIEHKIVLNESSVRKLYKVHPGLVISYLRLGLNTDKKQRDLHGVDIMKYRHFIPCLMKNHFKDFMEFWETVGISNLTLSNTKKKLFIEIGVDVLKKNPKEYLRILDLKLVTKSLSSNDFQEMIQALLPEKKEDFKTFQIFTHLQHYPEDRKLQLIKSVFKNAYGQDLYDNPALVTKRVAFMIPIEDRTRIAHVNAEEDLKKIGGITSVEENQRTGRLSLLINFVSFVEMVSWWCFLPAKEVIPSVEKVIAENCAEVGRENVMIQLIFCCIVNRDDRSLLRTLRLFEKRYKADSLPVLRSVLQFLSWQHELFNLSEFHWESLNASIENVLFNNQIHGCAFLLSILEKRVHYKLDHELLIDEDIEIMAKIRIASPIKTSWWILQDYAAYSRLCLEKSILYVGGQWLADENNHLSNELIKSIITSIDCFNEKILKDNADVTPLDAKNYDYITKFIVISAINSGQFIEYVFKNWLPNMYDTHYPKQKKVVAKPYLKNKVPKSGIENVVALRENYWKVSKNFEYHFNSAMSRNKKLPGNVWESIKWYQGMPSNFLELALVRLREEKLSALNVLGNILDGPQYEKVLKIVIPEEEKFKVMEREDAKKLYSLVVAALTSTVKCNPPVSLNIFKDVMNEAFKAKAVKFFYSVAHRSAVSKVLDFGKFLVEKDKVSVKKHGIRLIYATSSIDQKCTFLNSLLEGKTHTTIRGIVLLELLQTFTKNPSIETWKVLEACLERQTIDENEVYEQIVTLKAIPNDYMVAYITHILNMIKRYENLEHLVKPNVTPLISTILKQIDHSYVEILSDDFLKMLIENYVVPSVLQNNGCILYIELILNVYLTGARVEEKLLFLFENLILFFQKNPRTHLSPAESVQEAFKNFIFHYKNFVLSGKQYPQVTKAFKHIYDTRFSPKDNVEKYVTLVLLELYEGTFGVFDKFVDLFMNGFHSLIDILGTSSAATIGDSIVIFMDHLKCMPKEGNFVTIHRLLYMKTDASYVVAMKLFMLKEPPHTLQWLEILRILSESDFPTVRSLFAFNMYRQLAKISSFHS